MKNILIYNCLYLLFLSPLGAKPRLFDYGHNIHSQFGEDGIIQKIFEVIGTKSKVAIEFGAWDGFHLSNVATLFSKDPSWKAILIEGDAERFKELIHKTAGFNVVPIQAWVSIGPDDSLEAILKKHQISDHIDILSIDIDGNDYHIIKSLKKLRPRLIICEYNPTIPVHFDVYAPYSKDNNFGQSVGALNRIAAQKGYKLVALTLTNAFYVRESDFDKFKDFETDLVKLNVNDGYITLVTTYDGKYALIKNQHNVYYYGINEQFTGQLNGDSIRCDTAPINIVRQDGAYRKS